MFLRDNGQCVICGAPGEPNAHFIPRSQGGLGIEENIVTLCPACHRWMDQTTDRGLLLGEVEKYLKDKYPNWDKTKLIYRK